MAGNTLKLEIITPECVTVSDETTSIVLNAIDGYLGIWPNHAPLIAGLRPAHYTMKPHRGKNMCLSPAVLSKFRTT